MNSFFTSGTENNPMKETSMPTSGSTMSSTHGMKSQNTTVSDKTTIVNNNSISYPLGDVNHTGGDFGIFGNSESKDSGDFLNYGWSEIENFEDVDRIFRGCDSTFGLEVSEQNDLGWLSSAEDLGGSGDVFNSDFRFSCPETNLVDNMLEDNASLKDCSMNDSAMTNVPTGSKDSSWSSEKSDSYLSFVTGPVIADDKDEVILQEQGLGLHDNNQTGVLTSHSRTGGGGMKSNSKKQIKQPNQFEQKHREHDIGNDSINHMCDLPDEVMQHASELTSHQARLSVHMQQQQEQHPSCPNTFNYLENPISYVLSDDSYLSDPSSVNLKPSTVKFETKDVTSLSMRDSFHASNELLYTESSHNPPFEVTTPSVCEQREKLHSCKGSRTSLSSSLKNGSLTVLKYENHSDPEGVSSATPTERGSSNVQETSKTSSHVDDISQEAASFHQLQHVMEQLDLRTKLCIRDSLYRLARSAEQRHDHANRSISCGDERDAGGRSSIAEATNKCTSFMDIETDTNPIDRSIAHLLFHRPTGSSSTPAHDSFPLETLNMVHGSAASPALVENVAGQETTSQVKKEGV